MSHYSTIRTKFRDEKALVQALVDMGFTREEILIHKNTVKLDGLKFDISIGKPAIERVMKAYPYTNAGFEKLKDGTYQQHLDTYTFGLKWQGQLNQRYDYRLQSERLRIMGFQTAETKMADGSIKLVARR